ncbi:hypothetical protein QF034_004637 [Streptomyces africanus]|uniref:Restriction endonuclease n=1 Tax=Streptomyces africanus TaxID=231024 RepID=A0ABU0QSP1_9ACTN|nr:hypothetical protein [Streptomyces africanus]MDQ0750406.1 hypothetical protein [Streptomyces africanus]
MPENASPITASAGGEGPWASSVKDPNLSASPEPGAPGNVPPGEDLDLRIGWDRFEKLVLAVSRRVRGLRDVKFRRYGVQGQAQYGIDLAGREPDGSYTVIQCKDYLAFTAGDLRAAVDVFTTGRRPFDAHRLIIATSASTQATQVADELARLQNAHPDLDLDLWGSEQINDFLRSQGDVVARFWTRETAETFCTGAPLPGVPVPLPDRQEQAERILVGPLKTNDVAPILRQADAQRSTAPEESARLYGELANRLHDAGFRGHAVTMRGKQLDALEEARLIDQAIDLAAHLAVTALHFGERDEPKSLMHRIEKLAAQAVASGTEQSAGTQRHAHLVRAAVRSVLHPLGTFDALKTALEQPSAEEPAYQPLLVLLLAEHLLASDPGRLPALDALVSAAVAHADAQPIARVTEDAVIRLRLVRAEYAAAERKELKRLARRHLVSGRHAALINAREGRRCALEGLAEEALESWRDAVYDAIHAGMAEDAADWLYAVRAVNAQYGPFTSDLDDEHRLAQALRATGTGRLLDRMRSFREHALSAKVRDKPVEAALSARRWLTDTVITGNWAGEFEALEFLGDLYRDSREPKLAARYYQRAGRAKKLRELATTVGDLKLPLGPFTGAPWWMLQARAALVEAQADLIDDETAGTLLGTLTVLAERGRAGELVDSPFHNLTHQVTRSACVLAARGTPEQALALLALLAPDVPREPHQYRHSDDFHATACVAIAKAHPDAVMTALTRLFDLAEGGADKALELVVDDEVVSLLAARKEGVPPVSRSAAGDALSEGDLNELRTRVGRLDDSGLYLADVARSLVDPGHDAVRKRAEQARDRILQRPDPEPGRAEFGTRLVPDSYLLGCLDAQVRTVCLDKLMAIASDGREVATTRRDALIGIRNLVVDLPADLQRQVFDKAQGFVLGQQDGSYLDDEATGTPHPLSSVKISMGSASLRGEALLLAAASATTPEAHAWVRDQAVGLLSSGDRADLHAAAVTMTRLARDVAADVDANLMGTHGHVGVRQASAVLCLRHPARYRDTAVRLAKDSEYRVRRTLAEAAAQADPEASELATEILEILAHDPRHSVRVAALPG